MRATALLPLVRAGGAGSLADRATAALRQLVLADRLQPGARLPSEHVLAERFGVSRTVVREAVARLKQAGLLRARQGSGVFVCGLPADASWRLDAQAPGVDAVVRILELRRGFEAEAAALAAERRTRAQLAAIHRAQLRIEREERAGRDGVEADMALHQAILRASGNPHYPALWDYLEHCLRAAMHSTRANEAARPEFAAAVHDEHASLVQAIAGQAVEAARAAALRHVAMAMSRLSLGGDAAVRPPGRRPAAAARLATPSRQW